MFDENPFHVMRLVLQSHAALWAAQITEVTKPQYAVLAALRSVPDQDQVRLALASGTSTPTLTELLGRMEKSGLVERDRDPLDSRKRIVRLTEAGTALVDEVARRVEAVDEALLGNLDGGEREVLARHLAAMLGSGVAS